MRRRVIVAVGTAASLLLVTGSAVVTAASVSDYRALTPEYLSLPVAQGSGNCGDCNGDDGEGCVFGWHQVTTEGVPHLGYVGIHYSCEFGWCSSTHGTCEVTHNALENAAKYYYVIRTTPPEKLGSVVESLGSNVHLNMQRMSVQVEGCNGVIAVNIPLTDAQVSAIEQAG